MKFRPCIDIHNGKVKQIVGSSLRDEGNSADENFVSEKDAGYFAGLYRDLGLKGGHVIILNSRDSEYYAASRQQAIKALGTYRGGMMAGGGINDLNAAEFIEAGASHVIVTSFVFRDGMIDAGNLDRLVKAVGREHLCLDLSCRKKGSDYFVVTDRWQKFTDEKVNSETLCKLAEKCDEFLVHAVDAEGKQAGIDEDLLEILTSSVIPVTYAGGIGSTDDIIRIREAGDGRINATAGSALKIFGGSIDLQDILRVL